MTIDDLRINQVFEYPNRDPSKDYFLKNFPAMPDSHGLMENRNAVAFMSDEGFVYFLPFLMRCYEQSEEGYDTLDYIIVRKLRELKPGLAEQHKALVEKARRFFGLDEAP